MAALTGEEFGTKWATKFADNEIQNINEALLREFKTDIRDSFASLATLNVRQVKGATYPLPYTDSFHLIPPAYRILGMLAVARVGTTAANAATLPSLPGPLTYQLVANSGGAVDALVDEQPGTTATVKAVWVLASGTTAQITDSFPALVLTNPDGSAHPYSVGDKIKYVFADGTARLFEVRVPLTKAPNPVPTGEQSDPNYRPFAPLGTGGGASTFGQLSGQPRDNAALAQELNDVQSLSDGRRDLSTVASNRFCDLVLERKVTLSNPRLGTNAAALSGQVLQGGNQAVSAPRTGALADVITALQSDINSLGLYAYYVVRFQTTPAVATDVAHVLLTVTA